MYALLRQQALAGDHKLWAGVGLADGSFFGMSYDRFTDYQYSVKIVDKQNLLGLGNTNKEYIRYEIKYDTTGGGCYSHPSGLIKAKPYYNPVERCIRVCNILP